jgi:hypothetical protein
MIWELIEQFLGLLVELKILRKKMKQMMGHFEII